MLGAALLPPLIVKKNTQQRILDTSADLFNQFGIEAVSIAQVATDLKISTGNLTYYYKRKKDLVLAHTRNLERDLAEALEQFPYLSNPRNFAKAFIDMMALTLRYRFLFTGANYILQNDLIEFDHYDRLIRTVKRTLIARTRWLMKGGHMRPVVKPHTLEMLVDSIWWQWLGWLHISQLQPPNLTLPRQRLLADAASHIFFVGQAYVDPAFAQLVQEEFARLSRGATTPAGVSAV